MASPVHSLTASDYVVYQGTFYVPQLAAINASAPGANTIVAAASNMIIRVLQYIIVCSGAVAVTWESSSGIVIGGPMSFAANGGCAPPFNPTGHFATVKGEGLVLFLGGGIQVGGHLTYIVTS